jgi:hypothetical protein
MYKLQFYLLFFICFNIHPIFAQDQKIHTNTSIASNSARFLGLKNNTRSSHKNILKFDINYVNKNLSSRLALNFDGDNNSNLDRSYLQFTSGIATFGIGTIDRHWSFSNNTSLILSHNARPSKSIYMKLSNNFRHNKLPSEANWSFEIFNGDTEDSLRSAKSMLLGMRATLSPISGLDFELVQTSQWGGAGYETGISALKAASILDTNDSVNYNINKMAGFGISYAIPNNIMPLRIYGQAIGEDEAGNLPSCYAYLIGFEWSNTKIKYPVTIGIEAVDTRSAHTSNGFCGPNTFYNNSIYDYINYGRLIGAEIGTESTSLELFGKSKLSQKLNIRYSTKLVTINDSNWSNHQLSSKRQSGLISSLGISWLKNKLSLNGDIYNQGFSLDKAAIKRGFGIGFSSSIKF